MPGVPWLTCLWTRRSVLPFSLSFCHRFSSPSDHEETRRRRNSNAFTLVHPFTLSIHVGLSLVRTDREHDDAVDSRDRDYEEIGRSAGRRWRRQDGGPQCVRGHTGGQVGPVARNGRGRVGCIALIDTDEWWGRRVVGEGPGKTRRRAQTRFLHSRMYLATPPLRRSLPVKKLNRMWRCQASKRHLRSFFRDRRDFHHFILM